jgi:hypothetical protein
MRKRYLLLLFIGIILTLAVGGPGGGQAKINEK